MQLQLQYIDGGVTAPQGYFATGVSCGIKANGEKDLALLCSEDVAAVAGVFTTNKVKGHSLKLTMQNIKSGYAMAIVINSGNANACVGDKGDSDARAIAAKTAELLECSPTDVLVGSTGVIGVTLDIDKVLAGIDEAVSAMDPQGGHDASLAIMTTDTVAKEISAQFELQGEPVIIGGMAKGSGMINPNMATMICVLTTDANINKRLLEIALKDVCDKTFNRITIDGDTSVCDMVIVFANGLADNPGIVSQDDDYYAFYSALEKVCEHLAKKIVSDGEGATKLIEVNVTGAKTTECAHLACSAIANSNLVKTAIYGSDANWGRIITAVGYSGADVFPERIDISVNKITVCRSGAAAIYDESKLIEQLNKKDVFINVNLNNGSFEDRVWTCDFSEDYVRINATYRS
ncbi:MAG: bifunctional glutamate N-acetyltransferase/amino-acid acetyltransferase ArgJ [Oscillospiraceae bacterium]|nr:bifunctional glutamate N-acetyltransferase/amino-acid acetyltransferase ArgJ [Oscillospiraceae bacterium]